MHSPILPDGLIPPQASVYTPSTERLRDEQTVGNWFNSKSGYPSNDAEVNATVSLSANQFLDWWDSRTPFEQPGSDPTQPYDERVEEWESDKC